MYSRSIILLCLRPFKLRNLDAFNAQPTADVGTQMDKMYFYFFICLLSNLAPVVGILRPAARNPPNFVCGPLQNHVICLCCHNSMPDRRQDRTCPVAMECNLMFQHFEP